MHRALIFKEFSKSKRTTPSDPPKGAPRGGGGAWRGIPPHIMCYVDSGVFNNGEFKNDLHFHFGVPQPPQGRPQGGGLGGLKGVLSPILPHIMCYVNSRVFNSGEFENDLHFHFRVTPTPARAPSVEGWGPTGGVESSFTKYHVLCQFWGSQ